MRFKGRVYIGSHGQLRAQLLQNLHDSPQGGHSRVQATYYRVRLYFFWPKLMNDVKIYIQQCDTCQRNKDEHVPYPGLLQLIPVPKKIWEVITMNFIESLPLSQGYDCIMVIIDKFTKYAHYIPLFHPFTALGVAKLYLENVFKLHGAPTTIISDRDKIFTSNVWQELMKLIGSNIHMNTAYHPESDGQTERLNQCLEQYLRCMCFLKPKTWYKWISLAAWWYNTSHHTAIGMTLFQALYGYIPPGFIWDASSLAKVSTVEELLKEREYLSRMLVEQLENAQNRMKYYADRKMSEREFQVGDEVYLKL